jgi:hypothetical protein
VRTARTVQPQRSRQSRSEPGSALLARFGSDDAAVAAVHDLLLEAAGEQLPGPPRRRPFVSLDGTPLVYSASTAGRSLRLLVEPGALALDVPAQVERALRLVDDVLAALGWRSAADEIDAVVRGALPPTAAGLGVLRGGVGVGLAAEPGGRPELRLYLDLRAGSPDDRWQRFAAATAPFANAAVRAALQALADRVVPLTVPVGLAAVVRGGLAGLRLYGGVEHPTPRALATLTGLAPGLIDAFGELGTFGPQQVTVAYDLRVANGALEPELVRTKADACTLGRDVDAAGLAGALGLDPAPLRELTAAVTEAYGGAIVQHVGVGCRGSAPEASIYVQPAGLARC